MSNVTIIAEFLKAPFPDGTPVSDPPKLPEISEFLKSCTDDEKAQFGQQAAQALGKSI